MRSRLSLRLKVLFVHLSNFNTELELTSHFEETVAYAAVSFLFWSRRLPHPRRLPYPRRLPHPRRLSLMQVMCNNKSFIFQLTLIKIKNHELSLACVRLEFDRKFLKKGTKKRIYTEYSE